ncbi:PDCD5-related protein, partial [Kipferlia bialata]|eukprot:g11193.t1
MDPAQIAAQYANSDAAKKMGQEAAERQQKNSQRDGILVQVCLPAARARLARVKLVDPASAERVENHIVTLATQGKLSAK